MPKTQTTKAIPIFQFKDDAGTVQDVHPLGWGTVANCFHSYMIAVMQALWKLQVLYAENDYSALSRANNMKCSNNCMWANSTLVPHCTTHAKKL